VASSTHSRAAAFTDYPFETRSDRCVHNCCSDRNINFFPRTMSVDERDDWHYVLRVESHGQLFKATQSVVKQTLRLAADFDSLGPLC